MKLALIYTWMDAIVEYINKYKSWIHIKPDQIVASNYQYLTVWH